MDADIVCEHHCARAWVSAPLGLEWVGLMRALGWLGWSGGADLDLSWREDQD